MAQIFRREPATTTQERPKVRPAATTGGEGGSTRMGRLRTTIDDIIAELKKVTWPTQDETRNLTIVVIGISVTLGIFLGGIDLLLYTLYRLVNS